MEKEHIHDYRFVSSEYVDEIKETNTPFQEIAKVICIKCGEVKRVVVKL